MDSCSIIEEIKKYWEQDRTLLNGPFYESLCKQAAEICFRSKSIADGIFYLSESHAASLRVDYLKLLPDELINSTSGFPLNQELISFNSKYVKQKYHGLVRRLKEMPKEWTLVQITQQYNPNLRWDLKPPNSVSDTSRLHVVRFSCGNANVMPCHVLVPMPEKFENNLETNYNILQHLYDISIASWISKQKLSSAKIKQTRIENNKQLKEIIKNISEYWLKEWRCLLLGKFENLELENSMCKKVNGVFSESKVNINDQDKEIIYQIARGCAHLNEDEIESAVSQIIKETSLRDELCEEIINLKNQHFNLIIAKRHPVVLLLDEKLECIPWEMTTILRRHPVSRMPSIHFIHALFKKHENSVVDGNKIISNSDSSFYLVNPDKDLDRTEKRVIPFINSRFPNWRGLVGISPTKSEFIDALTNYSLLLYCGHGNGTQFLNSSNISDLTILAVPLLFGCSSFKPKNLGGRVSFNNLCHRYIIAGSPCMLGTLWPVTSSDVDCMAVTLLNHWLPGEQLDLHAFEGFSEESVLPSRSFYEPELLRVIKSSRDSAILFSNSASLVIYGLPVKVIK